MTFLDLSHIGQFLIAMWAVLLLAALIVLFIMVVMEREWNYRHTVSLIYIVIILTELVMIRGIYGELKLPFVILYSDRIPWYVYVLIHGYLTVYLVYGFHSEFRYRKTHFGRKTIREAIQNAPCGLCFSERNGRLMLTNHNMYMMVKQLTGMNLDNMEQMWSLLSAKAHLAEGVQFMEQHSKTDDVLTFSLPDGVVLQVKRELITIHGKCYVQTSIADVSPLHQLFRRVEQENEQLKLQHNEMRELADRMIRNNHEEEVLRHKIQIHNEMGQIILTTRQLLLSKGSMEEYQELALRWQIISQRFAMIAGQEAANPRELLQEILDIAEQIGCSVELQDGISQELLQLPLIRQAIREAIVNAVRHGQATKIEIRPYHAEGVKGLIIENNGENPEHAIQFRGGLKNLAEGLEAIGGSLCIQDGEQFALLIQVSEDGE